MPVEIAVLVSIVSLFFGIYTGMATIKREQKLETKKNTSEMTTVIVKLEHIGMGISEIKTELGDINTELKCMRDRLTIAEQSLKSAWKRIEKIDGIRRE